MFNSEEAYKQALRFARTIKRKRGDGSWVASHLVYVARQLKKVGAPYWVLTVALLHDSVEDGDLTFWQVWRTYGLLIAVGVLVVTKPAWLKKYGIKRDDVMTIHLVVVSFSTLFTLWLAALKMADRAHNVHPGHRHPNWSDGNYETYISNAKDIRSSFGSSNEQIANVLGNTINEALESLSLQHTEQNETPAIRAC